MNLSNLSQLLERNLDLLVAKHPILVNMPIDDLASLIQQEAKPETITCFDNHFGKHKQRSRLNFTVNIFGAHYQGENHHDLAIVHFPKSKNELAYTLAMLAPRLTEDAVVLFVGENKSGIKSLPKLSKDQVNYVNKIDAARHCLLFQLSLNHQAAFNLDEWFSDYTFNVRDIEITINALPGVFSQSGLDKGTKVLFDTLPDSITGKVLDFGTGSGVIAAVIGRLNPDCELHLADVNALAIASAKKTLRINNLSGQVFATDSLSHISGKYNTVFTNPPFHQGVKTHYAATESFLDGICQHMQPQGKLFVVANSFLNYQPIMEKRLTTVDRLLTNNGFTVYRARN